ncbi:transposase [Erwinia tracheiphila PSU-1]|nr:transposase [Erwinia tracheiphila PSU-1]
MLIITDTDFQNARFPHIKSLDRDFIGRVRGNIQLRLEKKGEHWFRREALQASSKPEYLGPGTLARAEYARCDGHFYLHKKEPKQRKNKRGRCRIARYSQECDGREVVKDPGLIFSSTDIYKPREIMRLYSRRMQTEQNFWDEKSERFGFGLRASNSGTEGRMLVLILLATLGHHGDVSTGVLR